MAQPRWKYSLIWTVREVSPSRKDVRRPAFIARLLLFLIPSSAQCIGNDDETRIHVLTPATSTGIVCPAAGQVSPCTTRMKKYAVKNAPKSMTSLMMKRYIPSVWGSTADEKCERGGPWSATSCS